MSALRGTNIEREEEHMNELYEAIEQKIKASGYPRAISGEDVYNDICDPRLTERRTEPICFCQNLRRMWCLNTTSRSQDEDFNLGILTMRTPEGVFEADFDA